MVELPMSMIGQLDMPMLDKAVCQGHATVRAQCSSTYTVPKPNLGIVLSEDIALCERTPSNAHTQDSPTPIAAGTSLFSNFDKEPIDIRQCHVRPWPTHMSHTYANLLLLDVVIQLTFISLSNL